MPLRCPRYIMPPLTPTPHSAPQSLRIEKIEFAEKTMQKSIADFAINQTKLSSQQQTIGAQRAIQVARNGARPQCRIGLRGAGQSRAGQNSMGQG